MKLKMYPGYMNEDRTMVCAIVFPPRSTESVTQFEVAPGKDSLVAECYSGNHSGWYSHIVGRIVTLKDGWNCLDAIMHTRNLFWEIEVSPEELRAVGVDERCSLLSPQELGELGLDHVGDPLTWITVPSPVTRDGQPRKAFTPRGKVKSAIAVLAMYRAHGFLWPRREGRTGKDADADADDIPQDERCLNASHQLDRSMDRLLARAREFAVTVEDVDRLRVRTYGLIMRGNE